MTQHASLSHRALSLTERLVRCRSVSRTSGEQRCALLLGEILGEIGGPLEVGQYVIQGDPLSRTVPWALLRGAGPRTVVLFTHFDTVDVLDYGDLQPFATEPSDLRARLRERPDGLGPLAREHLASDEWLWGRGAVDMKCGVAAQLAVLEQLAARGRDEGPLPGNVLLVSTPDEETESAGVLAAVHLLSELRERDGLQYVGAINSDYVPADDRTAAYSGSVGKLLPGVYVRGVETHVGEPFGGVDATLLLAAVVRGVSVRTDLADGADGVVGVPPVTLKAMDLKAAYDVQAPFEAYAYFNVLTYGFTPEILLGRIVAAVEDALRSSLREIDEQHAAWRLRAGREAPAPSDAPRVLTYDQLQALAVARSSADAVAARLREADRTALEGGADARVRSLEAVRELWSISGLCGPAAVVYYSPPYYPHASGSSHDPFPAAAARVAAAYGEGFRTFYPYVSDGSYMNRIGALDLGALTRNMPLWSDQPHPDRYHLPLGLIRDLDMDVVNIGVRGYGAHKPEERVHVPYSCGAVPHLIRETVLAALEDSP